jgi:hypothetical protein
MSFDHTVKAGTTSKTIEVMIRDSTTGQGFTGATSLAFTCYYMREGSNSSTPVTLSFGSLGLYSSGSLIEVTGIGGLYQFSVPDAALASGADAVTISFTASGAIAKTVRICLLSVDLRDATDMGVTNLANAAPTVQQIVDGVWDEQIITGGHTQVGSFGYKVFDLPVESTIADAVWDELESSHNITGSYGKLIGDNVDAPISGAGGGTAPTAAEIADAVWTEAIADHSGTSGSTAEALSNANAPTVQQIVDGVWDEQIITGGHTTVGSFGAKMFALPEEDDIADAVWDELITVHNSANSFGNVVQNMVDNIWDEPQSGHTTAGTFGLFLDAAVSSAGGGGASAADIADAVWNELQADHVAAGSFGEIATEIASILADTNELQSNQGDWATATGFNTVAPDNASIAAILADTNELQLNQGDWATATGFNTVAPDNASIAAILADTNELQLNQGNWLTATGFNTVAPDNASIAAILADTNELQSNQNNWLTATGFSTHSAGDVWDQAHAAHVTDGTFGAHLLISTNQNHEVQVTGSNHIAADVHEFQANVLTADATDATFVAEISSGGGGASASDIYDYFVDGTREDAFKADLTGIATSADVAALSSGGTGLNQITVRVQDTNSVALQGAVVNIDDTVLSLVTTPTGEVVFNLDEQSYTFDVSPPAGYDTPVSQTLSVTGDATLIFTLSGSGSSSGSVGWVG